jgi:TRAP transporter TAXI family solute receptor
MLSNQPRKTAATVIAGKIQSYIRENDLGAGSKLPSIDELSEMFSVSKATAREALQQLVAVGIIDIQQGSGTYVTDSAATNLHRTQSWLTFCSNMTPGEIKEARIIVEGTLIELAAGRISLAEIRGLRDLLKGMEASFNRADYERFLVLAEQFCQCIGKASGNRILAELVTGLRKSPTFEVETKGIRELCAHTLRYYEGIHNAFVSRDTGAARRLVIEYNNELEQLEPQRDVVIYYDVLGTGSLGGTFYTLGQGIAKLVGDHTEISLDINVTGGGIENVKLAQDRLIAIGITQADVAHDAYHGVGKFDFPHRNLRVIGCLPGLELQISTLASSGIRGLSELRGRRIAVGAYGGATVDVARSVLEYSGLKWERDYDPKIVAFSTAVDMLRNGLVDAVFYLSIGQSPALLDLALEQQIRLIGLDSSLIASLESSNSYWYKTTIEANTYPHQNRPVETIGIPTILVTHKDLPESDVYSIASSVFTHTEEIERLVWPPRPFSLNYEIRKVGVPYHPGAVEFFSEYKIAVE